MMETIQHKADFCVVGGGLAGMAAAVAAARHGAKTVLIQDRPVLGGNASSECRMWISGARKDVHETGYVEELKLENNYRNPQLNWSIWDSITYESVRFQPNLELILNCSVNDLTMNGQRITSVKGWQLTTQTWHVVEAELFADCSGDSILAPLSGADFRIGREARNEFGEDFGPDEEDLKTMGMSCLIQARETDSPKKFIPPTWANKYLTDADMPNRGHGYRGLSNFWWIELGGEDDSIRDTEVIRDRLLAVAFGVWDHIKNHGDHKADNWILDWVGFLPGKRESRRYLGDHILTQKDIQSEGRFDDMVAYGGWPMDDHDPAGMNGTGRPNTNYPAPSPYGIPYRSLYSRNVENLFFAGRNISVTHAALSSTRVMATCATVGQAVGVAAAIAAANGLMPRGVYESHIQELQNTLMDDDCYLPWHVRPIAELSKNAILRASEGDPEPLRNGIDRPLDGQENVWSCQPNGWVEYDFGRTVSLKRARLIFDSDLNRKGQGDCAHFEERNLLSNYPLNQPDRPVPATLVKSFHLDIKDTNGVWKTIWETTTNHQRLVFIDLNCDGCAVRIVPTETWSAPSCRLFAFEVGD
jgi:hypothetical protein